MRGRATRLAAALALAAVVLPACAETAAPPDEIRVRVIPRGGTAADERTIRTAAGVVDLALGEMGLADCEVTPHADGHLRIVLPVSQAHRTEDVLARLRNPKLGVEVVGDGAK